MTANRVRLEGTAIEVTGELTNDTSESWSGEAGHGIGYQLFDDPTGP